MIHHAGFEGQAAPVLFEEGDLEQQKIRRDRLTASDAEGAAAQPLQVLDLRPDLIGFRKLGLGMLHEHLTHRPQPDPTHHPFEKLCAKLVLKVLDPAFQGGGGDVQLFRHLPD